MKHRYCFVAFSGWYSCCSSDPCYCRQNFNLTISVQGSHAAAWHPFTWDAALTFAWLLSNDGERNPAVWSHVSGMVNAQQLWPLLTDNVALKEQNRRKIRTQKGGFPLQEPGTKSDLNRPLCPSAAVPHTPIERCAYREHTPITPSFNSNSTARQTVGVYSWSDQTF